MTLPVVQPVDWPDWGVQPTFSFQSLGNPTVNAGGEEICSIETGYFSHALIVAIGDGDGSAWTAKLQWWTADPVEGGSLISEQQFVHVNDYNNVIPVTALSGFLKIIDDGASTYPHSANVNITLFTARGFFTGYPGGVYAVNASQLVPGGGDFDIIPLGCGPGTHAVNVITDATLWTLKLRSWVDYNLTVDTVLADNTTPSPFNIQWVASPSTWGLVFTNGDIADADTTILATRQP